MTKQKRVSKLRISLKSKGARSIVVNGGVSQYSGSCGGQRCCCGGPPQ